MTTDNSLFKSFVDIVALIDDASNTIAKLHYPNDEDYGLYQDFATRIFTEFWRVFTSYVRWSKPERWMIDWIDKDTNAFGVLMVGEYTCLVQVNNAGTVSGHS